MEKFHNSIFDVTEDQDVLLRSTPNADTYSVVLNRNATPQKDVTQRRASTPDTSLIKRKFVGKFSLSLHVLKTPRGKRKIRNLNQQIVSNLSAKMIESKDINMQCAPLIIGYINVIASEFSEEKFMNGDYEVQAIDGNHSPHAQRTALLVSKKDINDSTQTIRNILYATNTSIQVRFHRGNTLFGSNAGLQCMPNCLKAASLNCIKSVNDLESTNMNNILNTGNELYGFQFDIFIISSNFIFCSSLLGRTGFVSELIY